MTEIKACPFCGHSGNRITVKQRYRKGIANRLMYWIECGYCGAFQPHHNLAGFKTAEKAIQKWNEISDYHLKEKTNE